MDDHLELDKTYHCPFCGEAMELLVPLWCTPGPQHQDITWEDVDTDFIMPGLASNWFCVACISHHPPLELHRSPGPSHPMQTRKHESN